MIYLHFISFIVEKAATIPAHRRLKSAAESAAFTLFGGRIVGRHLEHLPNQGIVQAWRVAYWEPGIFSVVRFDLLQLGSGTKLSFSHAASPKKATPPIS